MIKQKKGQLFIMPIIMIVLAIVLLILLIWFGFKISDGLVAIASFVTKWWWVILLGIVLIIYKDIIVRILNVILKKIGF